MWAKTKPEFVKKVALTDFEYEGKKPYDGDDLKKFGFPERRQDSIYIYFKKIADYRETINKASKL